MGKGQEGVVPISSHSLTAKNELINSAVLPARFDVVQLCIDKCGGGAV